MVITKQAHIGGEGEFIPCCLKTTLISDFQCRNTTIRTSIYRMELCWLTLPYFFQNIPGRVVISLPLGQMLTLFLSTLFLQQRSVFGLHWRVAPAQMAHYLSFRDLI
jgi:hypothetical protein